MQPRTLSLFSAAFLSARCATPSSRKAPSFCLGFFFIVATSAPECPWRVHAYVRWSTLLLANLLAYAAVLRVSCKTFWWPARYHYRLPRQTRPTMYVHVYFSIVGRTVANARVSTACIAKGAHRIAMKRRGRTARFWRAIVTAETERQSTRRRERLTLIANTYYRHSLVGQVRNVLYAAGRPILRAQSTPRRLGISAPPFHSVPCSSTCSHLYTRTHEQSVPCRRVFPCAIVRLAIPFIVAPFNSTLSSVFDLAPRSKLVLFYSASRCSAAPRVAPFLHFTPELFSNVVQWRKGAKGVRETERSS